MSKGAFQGERARAPVESRPSDLLLLLAQSRRLEPTLPFPELLQRTFAFDRYYRALVRDYDIVSHSPLFDPDWYVDNYRNVAENGEDPIHHFLKFGCAYELSPGPHFDTKAYLADHPSVRTTGENPLLHLIRTSGNAHRKVGVFHRWARLWKGWQHTIIKAIPHPYSDRSDGYEPADGILGGQTGPKFSFLIVAADGAAPALSDTLSSLEAMRGSEWDALIAGGDIPSTKRSARVRSVAVASADRGAVLAALLAMAEGEFFAVLDAGDRVSPDALQDIWACLRDRPDLDIIYTDEDVATPRGGEKPRLKPAWSPEYLESFDYFGRLTCIRKSVALASGSFSDVYADAAEYDLALRICDATRNIGRIPKILCHRSPEAVGARSASDGVADRCRALRDRWGRHGVTATVTPQPQGTWHSSWPLLDPPVVSVVILDRDERRGSLAKTIDGLHRLTNYPKLEIVVVEAGARDAASVAADAGSRARVRFVPFMEPFSWSAACNCGARATTGSLLLFLGAGIEVTMPDWLEELVRCVERVEVGIAGPVVVSSTGEVRRGGTVVGVGDGIDSIVLPDAQTEADVFGPSPALRNALGVADRCLMIRRDVFDLVGGFDETYHTGACCLALSIAARHAGYRTVCTPFATLRAPDDEPSARVHQTDDRARLMRDLNRFGILEDPYFHPALSAERPLPSLCIPPQATSLDNLTSKRSEYLSSYGEPSRVDLLNTADVILALGHDDAENAFWEPQSASAIRDVPSAMRFVIDLIKRDPDLRARFPRALSDGGEGAFALWLTAGDGRARFGLSPAAAQAIEAAFASEPADLVRRAYLFRDDVRTRLPLGCTPAGLGPLFEWLLRSGRHEHELRIEAIWWFVLECAERPAQELVWTYLFNPGWQRIFPDGLTVFARRAFARWLEVMYHVDGDWLDPAHWPVTLSAAQQIRLAYRRRRAWQRLHPDAFASEEDATALLDWLASGDAGIDGDALAWMRALDTKEAAKDLARTGANLLAHFCYPSGLRTSAESIVEGLHEVGCRTSLRDTWVEAQRDDPRHVLFNGLETFDTTIIHVQPEPLFKEAYRRGGLHERLPRTYRIAYWYWELDEMPASWLDEADEVEEIWVATRFIGDAARARFDKPVHHFLPGLELPAFDPLPRSYFGLAEGRFTFLFLFHMVSVMERKNPLGLVRAFRAAFGDRPEPLLVLKTSFGDRYPGSFGQLREAAKGEGIELVDAIYSPVETLSIMSACDCYVSLHRSEGLGLTMAEAMLLGKPVVATAYSGNLDFMNEDNSVLVDYEIVTLESECEPYAAGSRWAEPSIDHAAASMRRVYENQSWARSLGARAKADLTTRLSYAACGAPMAQRLAEIDRMRRGTRPDHPPG